MLFRKKIDRYCTYCQFAGKIDDETMVCQFCGIVPSADSDAPSRFLVGADDSVRPQIPVKNGAFCVIHTAP